MIEIVTRLLEELKKELNEKPNPSPILKYKITNDLDYVKNSFETHGSLLLRCKMGDKIYSPLDGVMMANAKEGTISIEHNYLFFDDKIRRVRTEFKNIKYIRLRENRGIDRLFECIRIKEGQSIAAVVSEVEFIEFKLYIDNISVDPEPYLIESYF